jgi:hypothetical protein
MTVAVDHNDSTRCLKISDHQN